MLRSHSEGFRHALDLETATANLTNALALLGYTPEQITDWCRAFTVYASVGGTIRDLDSLNHQIAIGIHKPEQEPTMTTETFTASNGITITADTYGTQYEKECRKCGEVEVDE